jgi:PhnB protein
MLSDEHPELDVLGPESRGGSTIGIHILVEDADRVFNAAVAAGAKAIRPVADQFYGERSGKLSDPFGHVWFIGSRVEDISSDEMVRRASELMKTSG